MYPQGLAVANRYDDKHLMSNEVTDKTQSPLKALYNAQSSSRNADCPSSSKPAMANRLLDWFSVVRTETKRRRQHFKPNPSRGRVGQCEFQLSSFSSRQKSFGKLQSHICLNIFSSTGSRNKHHIHCVALLFVT